MNFRSTINKLYIGCCEREFSFSIFVWFFRERKPKEIVVEEEYATFIKANTHTKQAKEKEMFKTIIAARTFV